MRYPKDLQEGGSIGFPAPSFGCAIEPYYSAFQNSLKKWKELGYKPIPGPNAYAMEGMGISNTPQKCAEEFMQMYLSKEYDVLISCGGGELMCEILDFADFEILKTATPKWFMGYSDNTNLTYLLATLSDVASIYGPCAAAFGMEPWHKAIRDTYELLSGKKRVISGYDLWEKESLKDEEHPLVPYNVTEPVQYKIYDGKTFYDNAEKFPEKIELRGRLLGGCVDCLVTILGTQYDRTTEFAERYAQDGILWFLEACDLNTLSIRRAMWQMVHADWFKNVKGFLIGRPRNGEPVMGLDAYTAVLSMLEKYNVPVIFDVDIGHMAPMMPLVVGSMTTVCVKNNELELVMEYK